MNVAERAAVRSYMKKLYLMGLSGPSSRLKHANIWGPLGPVEAFPKGEREWLNLSEL